MKTITGRQRRTLEDLSAEGLLRALPLQTLEKDIHVTDLLHRLSTLRVHHPHFPRSRAPASCSAGQDTGIQLVFAGGTCLSKAHRIIDRMSEDVDIKVVLHPPSLPLRKGAGERARLTALHRAVCGLLADMDLALGHPPENPRIRNARRYCALDAAYQPVFPGTASLRPTLKIEFVRCQPLLPLVFARFGYLYESLAGVPHATVVRMPCISIAETLAEKVLSLLRRCALDWDRPRGGTLVAPAASDPTLVRHVYDVARIVETAPETVAQACAIFAALLEQERRAFIRLHPAFDQDPAGVLRRTLNAARSSAWLRQQYDTVLLPLLYCGGPGFGEAYRSFEHVAELLLSRCDSRPG
ncbi:nucleotidyl transferase AbiEii/AbiGii toxin family protein [Bordetella genomosp. 1]|uniref:Nucleotidyl transferase AbiEii/AbiGii toxin family protein n=1 Tax=Bordetella genomosp. 1 TaxID=1395607 RepID=A0ABX4EVV1_9BORD|nr:nucleotidyl transferase AbiEii/AbiGii toxin family protein [Bordetella genomosp. 1]OZI58498.1 hypothetical protein CAL27_17545 [Bordetella genomosp. 1]